MIFGIIRDPAPSRLIQKIIVYDVKYLTLSYKVYVYIVKKDAVNLGPEVPSFQGIMTTYLR